MLDNLIFLLALVLPVLILLSILAFFRSRQALNECEVLARRVDRLRLDVASLRNQLARTMVSEERQTEPSPARKAPPGEATRSANLGESRPRTSPLEVEVAQEAERASTAAPVPVPSPVPFSSPASGIDWERFTGTRLFAWMGGLALFLGVAFLVKYSIEQGLISPAVRVASGAVIGIAVIVVGLRFGERYRYTSQALCAAGPAILFVTIYAACHFYHFIGLTAAYLLMTLVTGILFALAVHIPSKYIALLGLLGGFLTPVLVSTGADNPLGLFGHLALLDLGLILVALKRDWPWLVGLSALATFLSQTAWQDQFFDPAKIPTAIAVYLLFVLIYVVTEAWAHRAGRSHLFTQITAAGMPILALLFCGFALVSLPQVREQPAPAFLFVFLLSGAVLFLSGTRKRFEPAQIAIGAVTFIWMLSWTVRNATATNLIWALTAYLGFSLLHCLFPLLLRHRRPKSRALSFWAKGSALLPFFLMAAAVARLDIENPAWVFGLGLLLCGLLLGLADRLRSDVVVPVALGAVLFLESIWHLHGFDRAQVWLSLPWYLVFAGVFTLFPFLLRSSMCRRRLPWFAAAVSSPLHFFLIYGAVSGAWGTAYIGLLPLSFALSGFALLIWVSRIIPRELSSRTAIIALFAGVVLFFVTLVFPLQFRKEWLTLGWALEGTALVWLFGRIPHPNLKRWGLGLLLISFARLALNPAVLAYHPPQSVPVFNWFLYTYGTVTACLAAAAFIWSPATEHYLEVKIRPLLYSLSAVLVFLLLNIEIADFFSTGKSLTFEFGRSFGQDLTYSLAWALFGLAVLLVGIRVSSRGARSAALILIAVTTLKLFFYDLWSLGQLYRVAAFVGLAVVLILVSTLYQRFISAEDLN